MQDAAPYITQSALRDWITPYDVEAVLDEPIEVLPLAEALTLNPEPKKPPWEKWRLEPSERPNVVAYVGYGISRPLVVFVDRFENWVFQAEPGERNFGWLF